MENDTPKDKILEADFQQCQAFFHRPIRDLISSGADALNHFSLSESDGHKLERIVLLLDLVGTECLSYTTIAAKNVK
ncbi:ORF 30 [Macacine gammaherpesvirus 5]|uniref:ORF30 n=1 Tax=Rhesus monkey rhadinovirus H26-95 TaxID=69256 RepID=Q9J2K8_9GAMA|nr:ORF30 [Rhesus monkey rhadinovirus H26-95]QFN51618.1 ORF 30 [Macacine gammaherpesvirus 5]QFN51714.1 ORF 30 [Macacine gammaherpesvirus 5]QFN51805.1 ORF 30 [Macacine gammaherpesvirus 5]